MSKKSIIKGTLILTIAGLITKFLGFYNRIFLTRLIGVKELGVYQLIFPLYMLAFSFCCQGIATTLTKQVSYYIGQRCPKNATKLFRYSVIISFFLGLILSVLMNFLSFPLSKYILKNTDCAPLLKIISIAIPFVCIKTCINSYFMGMDKPIYQGISHLIEQIIRIGTAYVLSVLWVTEKVNSTLAVTAVIIGEISATFLAIIFYIVNKRKTNCAETCTPHTNKTILKNMAKDALPITTNNVMFTLFSSLEAIMLPAMLFYYYNNSESAMEMYGIITGIVIPFLLFPSTITNSLSTMLLPAVSYANAKQNNKAIKSALISSLTFCFFLGTCTCIFYTFFGEFLCEFAFESTSAGIILKKMCFLCPLIYISGNMSAILNGIDKAFLTLMYNIASISIRIIFILTLVPNYGVEAYIAGMFIGYLLLDILMYISLFSNMKLDKN